MEIKVYCYKNNSRKNQISKAIDIINGVQNHFYYKLFANMDSDICDGKYVNWKEFCANYSLEEDNYAIYITELPFDDNWFSHEGSQYGIITTHSWEDVFAPPSLKAYLVYQLAQTAICFEGDLSENMEMRMAHDFAEGCIFDFCVQKTDIKLGMIAGNICPQCRGALVKYGISEKALSSVERMLQFVRAEAIGKPIMFDENAAFVVMRFTVNDENDNAYKYGIIPALKALNIECVRADQKISSGQLLEKIKQSIERCRFVVVKVDSDNLNVYFELGFAMGLEKDVLLISEKELVLQLPSDLKNWECLTYTRGNYDELCEKIIKYYQDNYHKI